MGADEPQIAEEELERVAGALRRVIDRMVGTTAPAEAFGDIADRLDELADRLGEYPQLTLFRQYVRSPTLEGVTPFSQVTGRLHPFSPPVRLTVVGPHVEGVVTFGAAYEGPPGHVHGGFVAAVLDELLGMTTAVRQMPGMTGRLTVRYRRPTPLHTELRVVSEIKRVDGRKIHVEGRIEHDGEPCAEADGLFVFVDFLRVGRSSPPSGPDPRAS